MKILFYATSPNQPIGYSKIGNSISNYLAGFDNIDFYYIAIGNFKDSIIKERYICPNIKFIDVMEEEKKRNLKDDWAVDIIEEIMLEIKPDVFLIYNDIIVTCRIYNALLDYRFKYNSITKFVSYIDLVYPYEKIEYLEHLNRNSDLIFVFSDCWKENLINIGINPDKIKIFYHGISTNYISEIDKKVARKFMNINEDDFVILNTNRNCYRKAIDITISAFIKFFKDENKNPKLKLFLNMFYHTKTGYDIINIIKTECIKQDIDYNLIQNQILTPPFDLSGKVSDETINYIYNSCDVGINTCIGEGFGLCNLEHAYLGKPQIISNVGGLKDIFSYKFSYIVEPVVTVSTSNIMDGHNGDISFCSYIDFAEGMKFYYNYKDTILDHGKLAKEHIIKKYDWNILLHNFGVQLNEFINRNSNKYYKTNY